MMAESAFRGAIIFFEKLGVYDVVLPFLLVFTIVFAVLERTKIFGTEKVANEELTKKNLNAMAAFVIALLVVASTQVVAVINQGLAKVVLLLLIAIMFLMLIGTFFGKDEVKLVGGWRTWGMGAMAAGVLLIFMHELGWLDPFWDYIVSNWSSTAAASIILLIVIVVFMAYITKPEKERQAETKEKRGEAQTGGST